MKLNKNHTTGENCLKPLPTTWMFGQLGMRHHDSAHFFISDWIWRKQRCKCEGEDRNIANCWNISQRNNEHVHRLEFCGPDVFDLLWYRKNEVIVESNWRSKSIQCVHRPSTRNYHTWWRQNIILINSNRHCVWRYPWNFVESRLFSWSSGVRRQGTGEKVY